MSALELISLANQLLFVGLFVVVLWHAVRRGTRAGFDTALLFGSITAVLVGSRVADAIGVREAPIVTSLILAALSLPPYAMLRLVDDFRGTPRWTQVAGGIAYLAIAAAAFAFPVVPELVELAIVDHGTPVPELDLRLPVMADYAAVLPDIERIGPRTVGFSAPDGDRFYRLFVSLVRLAGVPTA